MEPICTPLVKSLDEVERAVLSGRLGFATGRIGRGQESTESVVGLVARMTEGILNWSQVSFES